MYLAFLFLFQSADTSTSASSYFLHKVMICLKFVKILEHFLFIFHSQKSIFAYYKSILPLSSTDSRCYNTLTLQEAQRYSASKPFKTFMCNF